MHLLIDQERPPSLFTPFLFCCQTSATVSTCRGKDGIKTGAELCIPSSSSGKGVAWLSRTSLVSTLWLVPKRLQLTIWTSSTTDAHRGPQCFSKEHLKARQTVESHQLEKRYLTMWKYSKKSRYICTRGITQASAIIL